MSENQGAAAEIAPLAVGADSFASSFDQLRDWALSLFGVPKELLMDGPSMHAALIAAERQREEDVARRLMDARLRLKDGKA